MAQVHHSFDWDYADSRFRTLEPKISGLREGIVNKISFWRFEGVSMKLKIKETKIQKNWKVKVFHFFPVTTGSNGERSIVQRALRLTTFYHSWNFESPIFNTRTIVNKQKRNFFNISENISESDDQKNLVLFSYNFCI